MSNTVWMEEVVTEMRNVTSESTVSRLLVGVVLHTLHSKNGTLITFLINFLQILFQSIIIVARNNGIMRICFECLCLKKKDVTIVIVI